MTIKPKVLAVDDEVLNLDIITEFLADRGYEVVQAQDGRAALEALRQYNDFSVILLDRMMPEMNGMEVLQKIKINNSLKDIPVIMQTAAASKENILEGIKAGAYYYLIKPYDREMLISIVNAAVQEYTHKKNAIDEVLKHKRVLGLIEKCKFRFRTIEEANNLSYFFSNCHPDPQKVVYGISEIMVNAVEHGNLGITYEEKRDLLKENKLEQEIDERLRMPQYKNNVAEATLEIVDDEVTLYVKDAGKGFDWKEYIDFNPARATDPNGRGIAMAQIMSFDKLHYLGNGNEVICIMKK